MTDVGFPHSDIDGSLRPYRSPSRFAVRCVLLQFQVARHSPYALPYLIFFFVFSEIFLLLFNTQCLPTTFRYRPSVMSLLLFGFQRSTRASSLESPTSQNQTGNPFFFRFLLRKEVIHPHVPVGIPCYDLTPVISSTFDGSFLSVMPPASGISDSHGLTGGVYKARERIHRDMLIRDY